MGEEGNMEGFHVTFWYIVVGMYFLGICVSWVYNFVLDISCKHLGDEGNLEGFLEPFWHIFVGMYIFGICFSWVYNFVLDISCQHLGDECDLEGFLVPFGHRVEKYIFWDYISCTYNLGDINYLNIIAGIGYKEPTMGGGDIYILGL